MDTNQRAAQSQGVGGGDKESESASSDRDADGRQAWQWTQRRAKQQADSEHKPRDISGKTGGTLDLDG